MTDQLSADQSAVDRAGVTQILAQLALTRTKLDGLAGHLRSQWAVALAVGDFPTVARLVEASHAVHRALAALGQDSLVPIVIDLRPQSDPGAAHP